jgi:hypothetical protein
MSKHADVVALKKQFLKIYEEDPIRFKSLPGMQGTWTPKMLVNLFEMYSDPDQIPQEDMADVLHVDRSTITRKLNKMEWGHFEEVLRTLCKGHDAAIKLEADDFKKDVMAKQAVRERRTEVASRSISDRVEESIKRLVPTITKPSLPRISPPRKRVADSRTPEDMVLLLSDGHVGYEYTMEETGNLGENNNAIFTSRIANLTRGVLEILGLHGETRKIPKLHVFGLGDFVHGSQLGGQWGPAYSIEDVTQQSWIAAKTMSEMISTWSEYFDKIEFTGVVGNHGRAGSSENSDKVSANWDRATYNLMDAMLKDKKNVLVDATKAWWKQKTVQGKGFLLLHGDYIRGGVESLLREEHKIQDLVSGINPAPYDYLCLGHFHSCREIETSRGGVIINGSFLRGDMYSFHKLRVKSKPTQMLFGVHPNHGITWTYKLDLDFNRE